MSDPLHPSHPHEDAADHHREHSEPLQVMGRQLVASLYMLVRSAKMYDPDNAVFGKPLGQLQDTVNHIIEQEGKLELMGVRQSFYLNGVIVKVDLAAIDTVKELLEQMRTRDVAGLTVVRPVALPELKNFVSIFRAESSQKVEEDGLPDKKLTSMRLASWSRLKDKLENEKDDYDARTDRRQHALTCYGRAVYVVRKYLQSIPSGQPLNASRSLRIIQDLVDVSIDHLPHLLSLSTMRVDSEYLVYHQVNTCLMTIAFGHELGLTKPQLRDVGYAALFHDAGMVTLPAPTLAKRGALTREERAAVARTPLAAVRNILREPTLNRATLQRLVTTYEHKDEFGSAVRDALGNLQMIVPRPNLGLYAKMVAIASTYDALTSKRPSRDAFRPEAAVTLMWTELRNKFDPDLLHVFMRVMAIQPVKVLTRRQQSMPTA